MGIKFIQHQRVLPLLLLSVFILFLSVPCRAVGYYADLTIRVDDAGFVTIEGISNYPNLITQDTEQYTSKQQGFWLLNITKQEIFSEYVFDLILPPGSSVNYIKSSGSIRIEEDLGNLILKGFGENESFSLLVQFQIEKQHDQFLQQNLLYFFFIPSIIIVSILLLYLLRREKNKKSSPAQKVTNPDPLLDLRGLNHRQKQIIQILQEKNVPLTQTDIQKELQIPKASVSRNIRGLERKGLIDKEQLGMSNLIRLKERH